MSNIDVTVYGKPNCVQCDQTERHLNRLGIAFTKIDITEDSEAYAFARALDPSYLSAPIVTVVDELGSLNHWSGYRFEEIKALEYIVATESPS